MELKASQNRGSKINTNIYTKQRAVKVNSILCVAQFAILVLNLDLFIACIEIYVENMLDDDFFELDDDLLNATDFSKKFDETGKL